MTEPIGIETHEPLRRLPWTGPGGKAEYVTPGDGVVNQIADSTEEHIISAARNDAAYALTMIERPEVCSAELRLLVRKLTSAMTDLASVADLRGERLNSPVSRALEDALRAALNRR